MEKGRKITSQGYRKIINRFINNSTVNPIYRKLENYQTDNSNESDNFITIERLGSNGRLGNQLFQVASTIGIGIKNSADPIFSSWYCSYTNKDMSLYFKNRLDYLGEIRPSHRYHERSFNYQDVPFRKSTILSGYFQSEKYFSHCDDLIRYYFEPTLELEKKIRGIYESLGLNDKNTCSLHIRRGDYVNNRVHGVCDMDYYKRAVTTINSKKKIDKFVIFSDDIEWCIQNFNEHNFVFSKNLMDIEDLLLMSMCDNHIISNSSFSWWGSWLCNNRDKTIICPSMWFLPGSDIDDSDVFPPNCIKI